MFWSGVLFLTITVALRDNSQKILVWGTPFHDHTCSQGHVPKCTILEGTPSPSALCSPSLRGYPHPRYKCSIHQKCGRSQDFIAQHGRARHFMGVHGMLWKIIVIWECTDVIGEDRILHEITVFIGNYRESGFQGANMLITWYLKGLVIIIRDIGIN